MWAQGSYGGHGQAHGKEAPWGQWEEASIDGDLFGGPHKDDHSVRHRLQQLRGEGGEGDASEAQQVSLLWAPGLRRPTLRVEGAPLQGDDHQAEGVLLVTAITKFERA